MNLSDEKIEEISEKLAAYPMSLLQDFLTFRGHCRRVGIDENEIPDFVKYMSGDIARLQARKSREARKIIEEKGPRCTICKTLLVLEDINDRESRMIDDHSKSWWVCPNELCDFEPILSDKYPYEILSDLGIQVHKKLNKAPMPNMKRRRAASQATRLRPERIRL
jgi:hypothetical protein